MTYETSKCQQTCKFSWFIDFSPISKTPFENSDNAIPSNFHFYVEKDRHGFGRTSGYFLFQFHPEMGSPISIFSSAVWRYFQLSGPWNTYFNISNKTLCNLCLRWNTEDAKFPKHLFRGLKYLCRIWLMSHTNPYGSMNPYGLAACFLKPHLSFPTQKCLFLGIALSEFSKCIYEIYKKINKPGELILLLTFGSSRKDFECIKFYM